MGRRPRCVGGRGVYRQLAIDPPDVEKRIDQMFILADLNKDQKIDRSEVRVPTRGHSIGMYLVYSSRRDTQVNQS